MSDNIIVSKKRGSKLNLIECVPGSNSQVFSGELVIPPNLRCKVAAKKVRLNAMNDIEIENLMRLKHKNIVKFYGIYAFDEMKTFMLMEYASNGDLYHFLMRYRISREERGEIPRLPSDLVWKWVLEAASAIQYLHAQSQIHRDIKSENFLISENYILKLGDLGMAKQIDATSPTEGHGTFGWMAPEVIQTQRRSKKSDVYSFGVVSWEICSAEVPYGDIRGEFRVMQQVCQGVKPQIPDDCPEKLSTILMECWQEDYNKRPDIDTIVIKLLPYQTDTDIPRLVEEKMKDVMLQPVCPSPSSSAASRRPDEKPCDKILDDKCLLKLAEKLGPEWEQLGTHLGFEPGQIYRLRADNPINMLSAIHKMLVVWRQKQDSNLGVKRLIENLSQAFADCGRGDLGNDILKLIPKKN